MAKSMGTKVAAGVILLALLFGILEAVGVIDVTAYVGVVSVILVIGGLAIGIMNIKGAESVPFMVAALVVAGGATALAVLPLVGDAVQIIFTRLALVVIPAAVVVALMTIHKKIK